MVAPVGLRQQYRQAAVLRSSCKALSRTRRAAGFYKPTRLAAAVDCPQPASGERVPIKETSVASSSRQKPGRNPWLLGALALASVVLSACGGHSSDLPPLELRTLSTRADLVSDGDVLMEVVPPAGSSASGLKVTVNGTDESSAFVRGSDGRITGVVTGLTSGDNVIQANS